MTAIILILVCGGYSVGFALENVYLRVVTAALLLYGLFFVARISVCSNHKRRIP